MAWNCFFCQKRFGVDALHSFTHPEYRAFHPVHARVLPFIVGVAMHIYASQRFRLFPYFFCMRSE